MATTECRQRRLAGGVISAMRDRTYSAVLRLFIVWLAAAAMACGGGGDGVAKKRPPGLLPPVHEVGVADAGTPLATDAGASTEGEPLDSGVERDCGVAAQLDGGGGADAGVGWRLVSGYDDIDSLFEELCDARDPLVVMLMVLVYHMGELIRYIGLFIVGDIEAVKFIAEHLFRLKRVKLYFVGKVGEVELYIWRDFGCLWLDESRELIALVMVVVEFNEWSVIELS